MFIGLAASVVSNVAVRLRTKSDIDDTLDVFPCHGIGGIAGMLLTAVFAEDVGLVFGQTTTFIHHLYALGIVASFTLLGSYLLYWMTDRLITMRVSVAEETLGLDMSQHGESLVESEKIVDAQDVKLRVVGA